MKDEPAFPVEGMTSREVTSKLRKATLDALHDRLQTLQCEPSADSMRGLANILDALLDVVKQLNTLNDTR